MQFIDCANKRIELKDNNVIMTFTGSDRKTRKFYVDYENNVRELENPDSYVIPFTPVTLYPV